MDPASFDRLTRLVSAARSRRSLGGLGLGVLGSLLAVERTAAKRCPKGRKKCKKKCIAKKKCCTNANCKTPVTHKVCRGGRCVCAPGFKLCPGGSCLPLAGCCSGCPAGQVCQNAVCCVPNAAALQAALGPGGPAVIQLCANTTYQGTFTINRNVGVLGAGPASSVLNGGGNGPVVSVTPGTQAALAALRVTNGHAGNGGGILNTGNLTMVNASIFTNSSVGLGGGIYAGGPLTLTNCDVVGNSGGGGIGNFGSFPITLDNCRISGNSSTGDGGGIAVDGGTLTLRNGTVVGGSSFGAANHAQSGAGIWISTANAVVLNASHVLGNEATGTTAGTAGGIQLVGPSPEPVFQNGSSVINNQPCDCNFMNGACSDTNCPT